MIDSPRDLFETLQNSNNDIKETILDCNYLLSILDDDNEFKKEFKEIIDEKADEYSVCSDCGWELQDNTYKEIHESYGSDCEEYMHNFNCINPDCNNY